MAGRFKGGFKADSSWTTSAYFEAMPSDGLAIRIQVLSSNRGTLAIAFFFFSILNNLIRFEFNITLKFIDAFKS